MIKLKAPKGASGCSFGGQFFEVDKKGFVSVPPGAVEALTAHGYGAEPEEDPPKEQPKEQPKVPEGQKPAGA
jgi:hypothetical protein